MAHCANCGRELQDAWKFCVRCGTPTGLLAGSGVVSVEMPAAATDAATGRVNLLAVLALILGILLSPVAALFGHLAVAQIRRTGERGLVAAWAGVALGWIWLVGLLVVIVGFLTADV